jgi:hypothetical protein
MTRSTSHANPRQLWSPFFRLHDVPFSRSSTAKLVIQASIRIATAFWFLARPISSLEQFANGGQTTSEATIVSCTRLRPVKQEMRGLKGFLEKSPE